MFTRVPQFGLILSFLLNKKSPCNVGEEMHAQISLWKCDFNIDTLV